MVTVAIQPDDYTNPRNPENFDASSSRWAELLQEAGFQVKWVDVRRPDILEQLVGCQGFMWRWGHFEGMARIARRLLPVIENELGLAVYPDQNTCWHYDDKIAQFYLLNAAGIPMPPTTIWFERQGAHEWAETAEYPLVLKLATGAGSTNVRLVREKIEAHWWIDRMFETWHTDLQLKRPDKMSLRDRIDTALRVLVKGYAPSSELHDDGREPQSGYVYFQAFVPDNSYDTRVKVIGKRAFGKRRFNRPNDFRASGSGLKDMDPEKVDPAFVRLAFKTARTLRSQSVAIDGLYWHHQPVLTEISYTYPSWETYELPGHWELRGEPETGELIWVSGHMWPEEAQVEDFIERLKE
jgi:glutathione synthase/RimK-type ligase-like ATP-grasp enzyme